MPSSQPQETVAHPLSLLLYNKERDDKAINSRWGGAGSGEEKEVRTRGEKERKRKKKRRKKCRREEKRKTVL